MRPGARVDREKSRRIDCTGTICGTRACRLLADDFRILQLMLGHSDIKTN